MNKCNFNKKILINFEGGEITGNAGLLVFHDFCKKLGVFELLTKYLPDLRSGNFNHTKQEIIYQKIIRIISGNTSNNNYEYHKKDPTFLDIHNGKIASSATCSRLENKFDYSDESNFRKIQREIEKYNIKQSETSNVIVDLDSTSDPCSTSLEGSSYIPHYGLEGYAPLFAFNGLNGDVISGILKPGKYHCSTLSYSFTKNIIDFYKINGVKDIVFRGDSAFPKDDILWLCEKEMIHYFFKLKSYQTLVKMVNGKGIRGKSVFIDLEYQAQNWSQSRRVVCCIDRKARETEESKKARKKNPKLKKIKQFGLFPVYSFVVTNNQKLFSEEVFSMYNGRATIEKSIEEAKNGFDIDHLSNSNFKVNTTNFQIHLLSIQLLQLFRKFTLANESKHSIRKKNDKIIDSKNDLKKFKKFQIGRKIFSLPSIFTIRKQIFNIPARIVKTGRKRIYKCASSFIYQEKFLKVFNIVKNISILDTS